MQALVIHARRTGYGVIRSLHQHGVEVIIVDDQITPVFNSNKISHSYIFPNITKVSEEFYLERLLEIGQEHFDGNKILVFTSKDDYLLFFAKNYSALSKYFSLSFESDYQKLKSVLGKKNLAKIAIAANVKIPITLDDESSQVEYDKLDYPVIIKPDFKNLPDQDVVNAAFRLKVCHDRHQVASARKQLLDLGLEYVVQEYIPGGDDDLYTVGVYLYQGRLLCYSMAKKIRQFPINIGECSFGELIDDDCLINDCVLLAQESQITGICQIEFKKKGSEYFLIEINPRVWSWHQIHSIAGVDLVKICAQKMFKGEEGDLVKPLVGVKGYWQFSLMDLLHNVILHKNISFWEWLKDIRKSNIHAFFCKDDLKPVIWHWKKTLPYIFKEKKNHSRNGN
jgi:D-aspartate ligase